MSELDQAVQAEVAQHMPRTAPPFDALKARKRSRERRRYAVAGAALSLTVVAVVVAAVMPSDQPDRLGAGAREEASGGDETAARLCAVTAQQYDADVARACSTTAADVRRYVSDPHGAGGDPSKGPVRGGFDYPSGWVEKEPTDAAAACYLDGSFPVPGPQGAPPADPALVVVADGATAFLVKAGPKARIAAEPLASETATVPTVVGLTEAEAAQQIVSAGFTLGERRREHSPRPAGTVLAQSPSGSSEAPEGTAVALTISRGPRS